METKEAIANSIVSIKEKTLPMSVPQVGMQSIEGNLVEMHHVYDFFGLDFANRSSRESYEDSRKVKKVMDYIAENFDDTTEGLRTLERELGAAPAGSRLIDHLYHGVSYKIQSFETQPKDTQVSQYSAKRQEIAERIAATKAEIQKKIAEAREAREYEKEVAKLKKLELKNDIVSARIKNLMGEPNETAPQASPTV